MQRRAGGQPHRHTLNLAQPYALSTQQDTEPVSAPRPRVCGGGGWVGGGDGGRLGCGGALVHVGIR